jgi:hypothetical protein
MKSGNMEAQKEYSPDQMIGWIDRLAKVNALIQEGHNIMATIIGQEVKEQDESKQPNCQADALMDEIRIAEIETGALIRRLEDLTRMF